MRVLRTFLFMTMAALLVVAAVVAADDMPTMEGQQVAQLRQIETPQLPRLQLPGPLLQIPLPELRLPLLRLPDLTPYIAARTQVKAGDSLPLRVTIRNLGLASAPGTNDHPPDQAYMVDLILSEDENVPVEWGVQPVYTGHTPDDFVEDMLLQGGRISNTRSIPRRDSTMYTLSVPIPKDTAPGVYCLAAVVDPGNNVFESNEANNVYCLRIQIAAADTPKIQAPPGQWIMPYGVGGTRLDRIKPSGLVDYAGITNAPFGWRLGLRHGYASSIPNATLAYYRWIYRRQGTTEWNELLETVGVHYVLEEGGTTSFPVYTLGPKSVGGKNLFEFRPNSPPSVPGATTYWPTTDWFGDIYSGYFDTRTLPDGVYEVKLSIFRSDGTQATPGTDFNFIVPTGTLPNGTITTAPAPGAMVSGGGFIFPLHIDNSHCGASIEPPRVGSSAVVDECGFLLYDPASDANNDANKVRIAFHATHPAEFATFGFHIIRGYTSMASASGEVSAASAGDFTGDGSGNFAHLYPRTELLGPQCPEKAAFSLNLYVYAKATNGWTRLQQYDARDVRAFALAPGAGGGGPLIERLL